MWDTFPCIKVGVLIRVVLGFWFWFGVHRPAEALWALREMGSVWGDELFTSYILYCSGKEADTYQDEECILPNPYHLVLQESSRDNIWRRKNSPINDIDKHCDIEFVAQVSRALTKQHESLFNAFATAAFFKFVVFSIFEMRHLLAIWKASRPMNSGEGRETMQHELSVLYSRFYGVLLGGIIIMYEFHNFIRPILLPLYSLWIPQIVTNVIRDSRKPLHPHYILGMTVTTSNPRMYSATRLTSCKLSLTRAGVYSCVRSSVSKLSFFFSSIILVQDGSFHFRFYPRNISTIEDSVRT